MRNIREKALLLRIAARHQRRAHEFPNSKALKEYLKEHPNADASNHTVRKDIEESHSPDEGDKSPKKTSWKDLKNRLTEKAKKFLHEAPKAIQSFVHDEDFRKKALQSAHKAVKESPRKFVQSAMHAAHEEAHEFKTAGQGLLDMSKGKKMSAEQKHALKKVATHVAIAATVTALTGGLGLGAAGMAKGTAAAFVKSLAKKITLKAVAKELEVLPVIEEVGHVVHHHMTHHAAEASSPEEAFQDFVAKVVATGLQELEPEAVAEALDEAESNGD